jgi:hypothetical protein
MICPACGLENPPQAQWCDCGFDFAAGKVDISHKLVEPRTQVSWPTSAGYVCAAVAFFAPWIIISPMRGYQQYFWPLTIPFSFGLAAVFCGRQTIRSGKRGEGLAQVAIGMICALAGTVVGVMMATGFDH